MLSGDFSLPDEVKPIWVEGVVTSEYERDTLPLFFSPDNVFEEYYDRLCEKNPLLAPAIKQVQVRNVQAREQRAAGYWQECLASLSQCIHLRRCIFEEDDFQYTGAVNHFLLSILNFASFFLRESATSDPKTKEIMLLRAFDLFKKSQDTLNSVSHIGQRAFFKAMISNNFANYFHRRKKEKAASQCALAAMKAFVRSRVSVYGFYFQLAAATSYVTSARFEDAIKKLHSTLSLLQSSADADSQADDGEYDPYANMTPSGSKSPPIKFTVQMLFSDMPITAACELACCHNMAAAHAGLHKYEEAATWCSRAMQLAMANEAYLKPSHHWIKAIKKTQAFCQKMAFSAGAAKQKTQSWDNLPPELQKVMAEHKNMAAFSSTIVQFEQQRQSELMRARQKHQASLQGPATLPARQRPAKTVPSLKRGAIGSLQAYVNTSQRQLVEEIMGTKKTPRILEGVYHDPKKAKKQQPEPQEEEVSSNAVDPPAEEGEYPPPAGRIAEGDVPPEIPTEDEQPAGEEPPEEAKEEEPEQGTEGPTEQPPQDQPEEQGQAEAQVDVPEGAEEAVGQTAVSAEADEAAGGETQSQAMEPEQGAPQPEAEATTEAEEQGEESAQPDVPAVAHQGPVQSDPSRPIIGEGDPLEGLPQFKVPSRPTSADQSAPAAEQPGPTTEPSAPVEKAADTPGDPAAEPATAPEAPAPPEGEGDSQPKDGTDEPLEDKAEATGQPAGAAEKEGEMTEESSPQPPGESEESAHVAAETDAPPVTVDAPAAVAAEVGGEGTEAPAEGDTPSPAEQDAQAPAPDADVAPKAAEAGEFLRAQTPESPTRPDSAQSRKSTPQSRRSPTPNAQSYRPGTADSREPQSRPSTRDSRGDRSPPSTRESRRPRSRSRSKSRSRSRSPSRSRSRSPDSRTENSRPNTGDSRPADSRSRSRDSREAPRDRSPASSRGRSVDSRDESKAYSPDRDHSGAHTPLAPALEAGQPELEKQVDAVQQAAEQLASMQAPAASNAGANESQLSDGHQNDLTEPPTTDDPLTESQMSTMTDGTEGAAPVPPITKPGQNMPMVYNDKDWSFSDSESGSARSARLSARQET